MKKIVIFCLLLFALLLTGCSAASKIAFSAEEYTIEVGETFTPEVTVRPKRFDYQLFSENNTIATVRDKSIEGLKPGVVKLRAISGDQMAEATVYVVSEKEKSNLKPITPDASYITFKVINYSSAQLETPVIDSRTLLAGTDITMAFPYLEGYKLSWFTDEDGRYPVPNKVLCPKGYVSYYAIAQQEVITVLTDKDGRVTGLNYPNLDHSYFVFPSVYKDETITGIADRAFYGDTTLQTIFIPSTYTYIGDFAFAGCTSLKTVRFEEGSTLTEIGSFAFGPTYTEPKQEEEKEEENNDTLAYLNQLLDTIGLTQLATTPTEEEEEITINDDYCNALVSITLPTSIKKIGSYAFFGCSKMETELPEGAEEIAYGAFRGSHITSADLKYVKKIGAYAFYECEKLSTVTNTEGVQECGGYAFEKTALMKNQGSSQDAFYAGTIVVGCYRGKDRVTLKKGRTLIPDYAFNSDKLNNLTVYFNEGEEVLIGWQSFYVAGYKTDSSNLPIYSSNVFLATAEGEAEEYRNKYPLLDERFYEVVLEEVTDKDADNFGKHHLLRSKTGKLIYDRFEVGQYFSEQQNKMLNKSPAVIDLSLLAQGNNIYRINSYAFESIGNLRELRLNKVELLATGAISDCKKLAVIDLTNIAYVTQLADSDSIRFSGLHESCVVLVAENKYSQFKIAWEGKTTALSKLRFNKTVALYIDGNMLKNVTVQAPCAVDITEGEINVWYKDPDCAVQCSTIDENITSLYGKSS